MHASDICPNVVKNTYDDPSVDENSAKLYTGEYVSFEVETTERGIKAVRVNLRRFDGSPGDLMCDRGRIKFTAKRANANTEVINSTAYDISISSDRSRVMIVIWV